MKKTGLHLLIITFFSAATAAWAAPDPPKEPEPDKQLEDARAAIATGNWASARGILRAALLLDAGKAEYHNLYAYSIRRGENPRMDLVFRHYNEALRLEPRHRGAHQYLGEAYLMVGNVAKAREHLEALAGLCSSGCEEYDKLKQAVADVEQRQAKK